MNARLWHEFEVHTDDMLVEKTATLHASYRTFGDWPGDGAVKSDVVKDHGESGRKPGRPPRLGRVQDLDVFLRDYERATNTHDFDEVLPLVANDAVYWFSNGTHVGLAAIRRAFESTWAAIADEDYRITDVRWLVATHDAAACVYAYSWSGVIGGQPRSGNGRGTNVLTRAETGWQIVHEHLSSPSGQ